MRQHQIMQCLFDKTQASFTVYVGIPHLMFGDLYFRNHIIHNIYFKEEQ